MALKIGRPSSRAMLYILLLVLISFAVVYLLINREKTEIYTPAQILSNKQNFIGKTVVVEGVYYSHMAGTNNVVSNPKTQTTPVPPFVPLNLESIENYTALLIDGNKYRFTGKIEWLSETSGSIVLVVSEIKSV